MDSSRARQGNLFDERGTRNHMAGRIRFCAFIHLLLICGLYLTVPALLVLLVWYDVRSFHILWIPGGLILLAIFRGILAPGTRCCICYQPLFLHRPIAKSRQAPVFQPFGIHSTAALLSLCARSLRCPYCGRVNRLAKDG